MKRKVYLTLGFLSLVSFLWFNIYITNLVTREGCPFWGILVVFLISLVLTTIVMGLISIPFISNDIDPFYVGLVTKGYRKVHHSELGDFYMSRFTLGSKFNPGKTKVAVYHQGYLYTKQLFELDFNGNTEELKNDVKNALDNIYKYVLRSKQVESSFDKWDGYLDRKSKRNDILTNKLNIK